MAIFISYSQKDKSFVDTLAANLVKKKHHVWMDRWELKIGDSLIDKVQNALTSSSAILLILSKNSVESAWCKKELNAGLMRELDERKTLLLPCLIEDCAIPLFLREKLYADFRTNPDEALRQVDEALAPLTNAFQSRVEHPTFFTDWAVDWKLLDKHRIIDFSFVDHGGEFPYVVLSRCVFQCDERSTVEFSRIRTDIERGMFIANLLRLLLAKIGSDGALLISDKFEKLVPLTLQDGHSTFHVMISYRRMGIDNGKDTVLHLDNNLRLAMDHMSAQSEPKMTLG